MPGGRGRGPGPVAAGSKASGAWKSHGGGKIMENHRENQGKIMGNHRFVYRFYSITAGKISSLKLKLGVSHVFIYFPCLSIEEYI